MIADQDERVFTVNAPGDDVFAFSYVAALRYAVAALAHDEQLERVRFALVPKRYAGELHYQYALGIKTLSSRPSLNEFCSRHSSPLLLAVAE